LSPTGSASDTELVGRALEIGIASGREIATVQDLWEEYWNSVGLPRNFQDFEEEQKSLPGRYAPPKGRLLLAVSGGDAAGTAAFRPLTESACEAKRLYVRPRYRGQSIGRALLDRLVTEARAAGYREMYGDTLKSMTAALRMYSEFGLTEVTAVFLKSNPRRDLS